MRNLLLAACLLILCLRVVADPIHDAAANGDVAGVQRLLTSDAKLVNARAASGATPLLGACIRGQAEIARLLVERGADVNLAQGDGWTPLHAAVCDGNDAAHIAITRLLLEHGAKLEARNGLGWTPLHAAALKGNVETLRVLLEKGTGIEAKDNTGGTALHIAAEQGQREAVALLLTNHADAGAKDKAGKTPAERALGNGQLRPVEPLLASARTSLQLENAGFADALQQLFASVGIKQAVKSDVAAAANLNLANVPFATALRTVLQAGGGRDALTFRGENGVLIVTRTPVVAPANAPFAPVFTADPRYRFYKTISRPVLNSFLSRAVTHYGLCSTSPEPASDCFEDDMRMLTDLGAKFIGRAAYAWVPPDDEEAHFRQAAERAARVHKMDPEIVLQACVFEAVYDSINNIPVPEWIFTEFGLPIEKRNFRYASMLYDRGKYLNHWTQGASVPDMSKLEARMYFYYRSCRYIDAGFEAIHYGQVFLMDNNDPDHRFWLEMLTRVRRYATSHARRGMVLCDAHTHGVHANGRLLFDFHSWPLMAREVRSSPQATELVVGYYNSIYGLSEGGVTPSGWSCDRLPYLCEFDCGGSSGKPGQPIGFPWHWGYDCGSWFAHQNAKYRAGYLAYADKWLRARNEEAWLQMPTRLNLAVPVDGIKMWHANTKSKACPSGFNLEESIKALWNADANTRH